MAAHPGGTRVQISGQPLIDRTFGGQLPDLASSAARSWPDRAAGFGLTVLGGAAVGLEFMDNFDPIFGPNGFLGPTIGGCQTLDC